MRDNGNQNLNKLDVLRGRLLGSQSIPYKASATVEAIKVWAGEYLWFRYVEGS